MESRKEKGGLAHLIFSRKIQMIWVPSAYSGVYSGGIFEPEFSSPQDRNWSIPVV